MPLLAKCKCATELAVFGKLLLWFSLRNEDDCLQEGEVVTLKTLLLPSSWHLLLSLFKAFYLSMHPVLQFVWRWAFSCRTPRTGFNSASVLFRLANYFEQRSVLKRKWNSLENGVAVSSCLCSHFCLGTTSKWGPRERQERGKDVWVLLSTKTSQIKAKFLTTRTL